MPLWCLTRAHSACPRASQIDVRFANRDQGSLAVVVAPVLRFAGRPMGLPLSHACAECATLRERAALFCCAWHFCSTTWLFVEVMSSLTAMREQNGCLIRGRGAIL